MTATCGLGALGARVSTPSPSPAPATGTARSQRKAVSQRPRMAARRAVRSAQDVASPMGGPKDGRSDRGWRATWVLGAALLCLHLLPLRAQAPPPLSSGYNQLSNPSEYSRQMTVNKIIVHPEYNQRHNMGSDITLLQMHLPVEFNAHIRPACIPEPTISLPTKLNCWISGWGMLTEQKFLPEPLQLQEAEVTLVTNNYCKMFYPTPPGPPRRDVYGIYDDMVCAGDLFTGKSICRGDSGGPLVCPLNGTWFLIGVSSFSMECNRYVSLSVFTRISYFANWIDERKKATPTADPSLAPPQEAPSAVNSMASLGTVHKPGICAALVSSHVFLLLLIILRRL
ncbi:serine protease 40-like [Cynocephalus volans]|uniref:serine protease 40-like n=1 Tax=Cynocephalus volans TaxID=110931 RepID=UPI002FC9523A